MKVSRVGKLAKYSFRVGSHFPSFW